MKLTTCCLPSWQKLECLSVATRRNAAIRILLSLCRLFEIAWAIKEGARVSHIKIFEDGVLYILHEDLSRLSDFSLHYNPHDGCQVCSLDNAMRMLARSMYADQCTEFILSTTGDTDEEATLRANFDWAAVYRNFMVKAALSRDSRSQRRFLRAEAIACILREITGRLIEEHLLCCIKETREIYGESGADELLFPRHPLPNQARKSTPSISEPATFVEQISMPEPESDLAGMLERMSIATRRMSRLQGGHLRIIR